MTDTLATSGQAVLSLADIRQAILAGYGGVVPIATWGETSFFYNPSRALARGAYFCTLKDHDGENDRASALNREGVYRLSFGVAPTTYVRLFGARPTRPAKGGVVAGDWDFTALDRLMPHPVYAWMGWLSILNPTRDRFDALRPLLGEAHRRARDALIRRLR